MLSVLSLVKWSIVSRLLFSAVSLLPFISTFIKYASRVPVERNKYEIRKIFVSTNLSLACFTKCKSFLFLSVNFIADCAKELEVFFFFFRKKNSTGTIEISLNLEPRNKYEIIYNITLCNVIITFDVHERKSKPLSSDVNCHPSTPSRFINPANTCYPGKSNSRLRQTNEDKTCPGTAKDWVLWPGQSNAGTSIKLQSQNPRLTASSKLVVNLFRQINLPNLEFTR